jgi:hypothetical protein
MQTYLHQLFAHHKTEMLGAVAIALLPTLFFLALTGVITPYGL